MPVLHTNHGDIDYEDIGTGDTTLFLMPGWCQPKTVFNDFSGLASAFFRVVTIDWRGHGKSTTDGQDFDGAALLTEALTLIEHLGLTRVVPVSVAHASWIAVDLAEQLTDRVPAVIFLDWIMNQPATEFYKSINEMQHENSWEHARNELFEFWLAGSDSPVMIEHLKTEMAASSYQLWRLAGQVIADAYRQYGSPLQRLEKLKNPPQATHIYSLDRNDEYLALQQRYALAHDFFKVKRLENARTHLAVLEKPGDVLAEIVESVSLSPAGV
ncbi:alpha/beta fold hydrolase [Erwinia sorbitola]|uniref:Alpha/beta fold hydrolase n=1 Tax=Erwinia sorbitola TaxID=2681984 RepID=A0A6I6EKN7_9GAMM|nr:alpha/beta hydrolase [Erwinia sorbitola]MTD26293.1 alpha/beta fold hydrolase [Erwinia sorbitola]QGU87181.1 alpha/beta fold hydrolase [Erwinia sorbitola]